MAHYLLKNERHQVPINAEPMQSWIHPDGAIWANLYCIDDGFYLRFPDLADFMIPAGEQEIICYPAVGTNQSTAEHLFLNQVLPLKLSQNGALVLHGSAIDANGDALAFVGASGRGKSTLAASFAVNGFPLLTDDGLVLNETATSFQVVPSHPSIRLWEDSQIALDLEHVTNALPVMFTTKSRLLAGTEIAACKNATPLKRIYFLGNGTSDEVSIRQMFGSEITLALIKHSFLLNVRDRATLTNHFNGLASLTELPIFFELDYPRNFDTLPHIRNTILEHARITQEPSTPTHLH